VLIVSSLTTLTAVGAFQEQLLATRGGDHDDILAALPPPSPTVVVAPMSASPPAAVARPREIHAHPTDQSSGHSPPPL
jgi:hypothetical protein